MPDKTFETVVIMPDNSKIEVHYYCKDDVLDKQKSKLYIQLHDCLCTLSIEKKLCNNVASLERIVHNKVINTKGHLC